MKITIPNTLRDEYIKAAKVEGVGITHFICNIVNAHLNSISGDNNNDKSNSYKGKASAS